MKKNLFVLFDLVAITVASTIILADNEEVVMRDLKNSQLPGTMGTDPQDYDLLQVGSLETEDGTIAPIVPKKICNLGALKHGTGKDKAE